MKVIMFTAIYYSSCTFQLLNQIKFEIVMNLLLINYVGPKLKLLKQTSLFHFKIRQEVKEVSFIIPYKYLKLL